MKRILAWMLALCLICLMLPACGLGEQAPLSILYDSDDITVALVSLQKTGTSLVDIRLRFRNDTDRTMAFVIEAPSVNGVTMDHGMYTEVLPGTQAEETFQYVCPDIPAGNGMISRLQLSLHAYDTKDYENYISENVTYIPPEALAGSGCALQPDPSWKKVFSNDVVTLYYIGQETAEDWSESAVFVCQNHTDRCITAYVDHAVIDHENLTVYSSSRVAPGCCGLWKVTWPYDNLRYFASEMEKAGLTELELVIGAYDEYDADALDDLFMASMDIDFHWPGQGTIQ